MRYLLLLLPLALLSAQTPVRKVADVKKAASTVPAPAMKNFKESGAPGAPISMEIYTDYQCPSCRAFYMEIMPRFTKEYVATGKVKVVHRDFPLPMHQFGGLAAKFANAAGQIGRYDLVANQIFKTQPEWSQNGNVDAQVAKVLPPGEMQKVRDIVKSDARLDDTVTADVAMGNKDHVNQTPTLVIVKKGNRQPIGGMVEYGILKSYIDQLLAKG